MQQSSQGRAAQASGVSALMAWKTLQDRLQPQVTTCSAFVHSCSGWARNNNSLVS